MKFRARPVVLSFWLRLALGVSKGKHVEDR